MNGQMNAVQYVDAKTCMVKNRRDRIWFLCGANKSVRACSGHYSWKRGLTFVTKRQVQLRGKVS